MKPNTISLAKNQTVILEEETNTIFFQSYNTIVCKIEKETVKGKETSSVTVTAGQPQSATTARWLQVFLVMYDIKNHRSIIHDAKAKAKKQPPTS